MKTLNTVLHLETSAHLQDILVLISLIASAGQGHSINAGRNLLTLEPGVSSGAAACCRGGFSSQAMSSWNAC